MSWELSQRGRRTQSPSTRQGPIRATKSFSLVPGSPTKSSSTTRKTSPTSSPTSDLVKTKAKGNADSRASPERASPSSPGFRVEKAVRPNPSQIKRTGSLDTITEFYLSGQWPNAGSRDNYSTSNPAPRESCRSCADKSTQTSADWEESVDRKRKTSHKRSSSLGGNGDSLNKESIKARLARNKEGSKQSWGSTQLSSPVQASHSALQSNPSMMFQASAKSSPIPVSHIPRSSSRFRGSAEGLNLEIEVLTKFSGLDLNQDDLFHRKHSSHCSTQELLSLDGRQAPVRELLSSSLGTSYYLSVGSVDTGTQTPSGDLISETTLGVLEEREDATGSSSSSSSSGSRSQSESPSSMPIIPGCGRLDSPWSHSRCNSSDSKEDKTDRDTDSPEDGSIRRPAFVREPPDGCEKVVVEEPRMLAMYKDFKVVCPSVAKKSNLFRIPGHKSAFLPLTKAYEMGIKSQSSGCPAASLSTVETQ